MRAREQRAPVGPTRGAERAETPPPGFEPGTCGLEVRCSIQLSYGGSLARGGAEAAQRPVLPDRGGPRGDVTSLRAAERAVANAVMARATITAREFPPVRMPRCTSQASATNPPSGAFETSMTKTLTLTLTGLLAALALVPATAGAKTNVRVGIGDQQVSMFDSSLFQARKFKLVRYFVPWNVMSNADQLAQAKAYVERARQDHIQVLLHLSSNDLRIKKAKLPSAAQYRTQIKRIVAAFRPLGVRDFGAWNEVNHASQPTYKSPTRAADFFVEAYRAIKPRCSFCNVVALDVLDQRGVERYMRSFYGHLSSTYRQRARLVGIHNYGDVNRQRTTFTRSIIRQSRSFNKRTRFWFTETGGIVKFGRSFPCSKTRARNRLRNMFSLARTYRSSGVERLYVYNWTAPRDGCKARFDAGLVNFDGTPRPAYNYLRDALPNFLR
jgi:hypothetical protein